MLRTSIIESLLRTFQTGVVGVQRACTEPPLARTAHHRRRQCLPAHAMPRTHADVVVCVCACVCVCVLRSRRRMHAGSLLRRAHTAHAPKELHPVSRPRRPTAIMIMVKAMALLALAAMLQSAWRRPGQGTFTCPHTLGLLRRACMAAVPRHALSPGHVPH